MTTRDDLDWGDYTSPFSLFDTGRREEREALEGWERYYRGLGLRTLQVQVRKKTVQLLVQKEQSRKEEGR